VIGNVLALEEILSRQHGILTRTQLLANGIDDRTMTRRVRQGEWQRPAPGLYSVTPGRLSAEQRRLGAALYLRGECQITGPSALHWYGFRYAPASDRVHALVDHAVHRRSTGFIAVMRTHEMDPRARDAEGYRVVSPARAVVDTARILGDLNDVRAVMSEAVQSRHADLTTLAAELRRAKRSRTALANHVLEEITDGARSAPEAQLRALILGCATLPPVLWNPVLIGPSGARLPSPDAYVPDAGIAIEVDSVQHHSSGEDFQRTLDRGNELSRHGIVVLHFTPAEIRRSSRRVLRVVEAAVRERMLNPVVVPVTAVPRQ
jgi:hypothetical protein